MSQLVKQEPIDAGNEDIRSIEDSEWTLELDASSIGTIDDGNAQGNESNSTSVLLLEPMQLEKLKEAAEKAKLTIQKIQQKAEAKEKSAIAEIQQIIDQYAKEMANRNAEYQRQKLEMEAKNMEENANFSKEMAILKKSWKNKIKWDQVDLVMCKRLRNPARNRWEITQNGILTNGLIASRSASEGIGYKSICAEQGFVISENFTCIILYYFETMKLSATRYTDQIRVGLSRGNIPTNQVVGNYSNSYGIRDPDGCDNYLLAGKEHPFEWPNGAIKPIWKGVEDVVGCGILLSSKKEWSIFFTANGILMGKQILIDSMVGPLYPTLTLYNSSVEANFGDDPAKPFKYDIVKCLGLVFE